MHKVTIDSGNISIKFLDGDDDMGEEINKIIEDSGITVRNIIFPISAYYIRMKEFGVRMQGDDGVSFECGNIIDSLDIILRQDTNNNVIVFDFDGVNSISETFSSAYAKLLLNTSSKIITINMSVSVYRNFNSFIETNILEAEE